MQHTYPRYVYNLMKQKHLLIPFPEANSKWVEICKDTEFEPLNHKPIFSRFLENDQSSSKYISCITVLLFRRIHIYELRIIDIGIYVLLYSIFCHNFWCQVTLDDILSIQGYFCILILATTKQHHWIKSRHVATS